MEFYFIRHGKTEWNLARRFQGAHGDSPLLPQSYVDMKDLAKYLDHERFEAIYASPLPRALNTAKGIQAAMKENLPIIIDDRLHEFDLGKLEGMTFDNAEKKFKTQVDNFWNAPDKYNGKELAGEDYEDVIARGKAFARDVFNKYPKPKDKVIVVSHGAALSAIMGGLLGYPLHDIRKNGGLGNTSLSILETDNGKDFKKIAWNKSDYLKRETTGSEVL